MNYKTNYLSNEEIWKQSNRLMKSIKRFQNTLYAIGMGLVIWGVHGVYLNGGIF
ncbi:hypothetical protein [Sediminitomix flava]|uniref:hypothetical protein n=1 Tax=Sediminitomix flava TaxID=379075 RepID=UPI001304F2C6|nr:hypothetical protein [Sediminitomix flava]